MRLPAIGLDSHSASKKSSPNEPQIERFGSCTYCYYVIHHQAHNCTSFKCLVNSERACVCERVSKWNVEHWHVEWVVRSRKYGYTHPQLDWRPRRVWATRCSPTTLQQSAHGVSWSSSSSLTASCDSGAHRVWCGRAGGAWGATASACSTRTWRRSRRVQDPRPSLPPTCRGWACDNTTHIKTISFCWLHIMVSSFSLQNRLLPKSGTSKYQGQPVY